MTNTSSHKSDRSRSNARRHARSNDSASLRGTRVRPKHGSSRSNTSHAFKEQPSSHRMPPALADLTDSHESPLLSRRKFLYGAIGIGAIAAIGGGTFAAQALNNDDSDDIKPLDVPKDNLLTQNDFEALDDFEDKVTLVNSIDVPYGTLLWVNDNTFAACLLPTKTGSPLAQIGFLNLQSGYLETIREEPVGKADEFDIYDVRVTSNGVIWTEANIMQGTWRIYTAKRNNGVFEKPILVDEGDRTYETPTLAAIGNWGFWQKVPRDTKDLDHCSEINKVSFGTSSGECLLETKRRNATPLYADATSIIASPRLDTSTVYHELTRINASDGHIMETLLLPRNIKPLEAGYGKTGFMFSFPDIYNSDNAISNLGTYAPLSMPPHDDYDSCKWFSFARTPTAAPAWAGDLLIVKSTYSICCVDLSNETYFAIDVENGADSFGEYLASTGTNEVFVTFTNVDHTPVNGERTHTGRVKIWKPI